MSNNFFDLVEKKKKKNKNGTSNSGTVTVRSSKEDDTEDFFKLVEKIKEDVAPVKEKFSYRSSSSSNKKKEEKKKEEKEEDIAPVVDTSKSSKKSSTEDQVRQMINAERNAGATEVVNTTASAKQSPVRKNIAGSAMTIPFQKDKAADAKAEIDEESVRQMIEAEKNAGVTAVVTPTKPVTNQRPGQNIAGTAVNQQAQQMLADPNYQDVINANEEGKKLDFFQKGAFEDGYQFGDVTKAILGTGGDAAVGAAKGFVGVAESVADLGAYGVAWAADLLGGDYYAQELRKSASENWVDEATKGADDYLNQYSVLGRTSDAIAQGIGQIGAVVATGGAAGAAGLGATGTTAVTSGLMGLSGAGSGMSEAYQNGATDLKALQYGLASGAADAVTELFFGGLGKSINAIGFSKGLSSADDMLAKALTKNMKSQIAKNVVQFGVKAGAEGLEEVIAGIAQAYAKSKTYMSEEDFLEILADENLLEQFVVGAAVSGIAQTGDLSRANRTKTDFITGQTQNEQAVIKKEIENRIAEAEKDGTKLTAKEKSKIEAQVESDLEKGYISTDTIEEVLGGETYQRYKETVDSENALVEQQKALQEEFGTLNKMKQSEMTGEQIDRRTDLKEELAKLKETIESTENHSPKSLLKQRLSETVSEMVRSDRLIESYNEKNRVYEDFVPDYEKFKGTKHEDAVKKTLDNAVKVGANNTNRVRDMVEFHAKLSGDTGLVFEYKRGDDIKADFIERQTNKIAEFESIPETQRTAEQNTMLEEMKSLLADVQSGKTTVNGDITSDGIVLNLDSDKPLNRTVGHEVTHSLENAKHYEALRDPLFAYAKSKGVDIDAELAKLKAQYAGITDANPEAELVADLVGDYLFNDPDFASHLSTQNRNVFQKVYDEIKYLFKLATAGSKEYRELERVKKAFDDAYREGAKNTADGGVKYDIVALDNGNVYVTASRKVIEGTTKAEQRKNITDFFSVLLDGKPSLDIQTIEGDTLTITKKETATKARDDYKTVNGQQIPMTDDEFTVKMHVESHIDEVAEVSMSTNGAKDNKNHPFAKDGFTYRRAYFEDFDGQYYEVTLSIGHNGTVATVYNVGKIKGSVPPSAKIIAVVGSKPLGGTLSKDGIPQNSKKVNRKHSLSDSDGNKLTNEQADYFKDSKVRDADGNLKVMYHGSQNGGFHTFDSAYSDDGTSLFFVDSNDVASSYSGTSETYAATTFRTADDFNKFFAEIGATEYEVREQDGKFKLYEDGDFAAESDTAEEIYEEFRYWSGLGEGNVNYKVYLNLKNPLEVDAEGKDWHALPGVNGSQQYEYIKLLEVGDDGKVTIEYSMVGDSAPATERVELYDKFESSLADTLSNMAPGESLEGAYANPSTTRDYAQYAKENGYDGVIFKNIYDIGGYGGNGATESTVAIAFDSNQIKSVANTKPTGDPDIRRSLSETGAQVRNPSRFDIYGKDMLVQKQEADIAPVVENTTEDSSVAEVAPDVVNPETETIAEEELFPDDLSSVDDELDDLLQQKEALEHKLFELAQAGDFGEQFASMSAEWGDVDSRIKELEQVDAERFNALDDADAPPESVIQNDSLADTAPIAKKDIADIANEAKATLGLKSAQMGDFRKLIEEYSRSENPSREQLFNDIKEKFGTYKERFFEQTISEAKKHLRTTKLYVDEVVRSEIPDFADFKKRNRGKVIMSSNGGLDVDIAYMEMNGLWPHLFPDSIINSTDQLEQIVSVANKNSTTWKDVPFDDNILWEVTNDIADNVSEAKQLQAEADANEFARESFDSLVESADEYAPVAKKQPIGVPAEDLAPTYDVTGKKGVPDGQQSYTEEAETPKKSTRAVLHTSIVDNIKNEFADHGYDLDDVLKNAKNLSTFATVDNTPQRVMEKALGYKEGGVLADLTVNKVAQNETEGIKWLNSFTDRKSGLLAQISKQYNIKPGSKESAAAQMYAEGFYVAENNDIIQYGDAELAKDFPDATVQKNIKGLARDPRIRKIYDDTLAMINESRIRNAYPEIPRLDNYFLHFRAMEDTFSKLGLPFNPNDIRAKDLPTDLNGVTADLKPGQPYFASAMHRTGKRTSFDLLGGLERYLSSAKNQIYHIDDIQTLRALRNYIADSYGQANGLEGLDALSEEEAQDRIEKVYNSHLSTFAKFLNEEANVLAGKTALIDRGLEGIIGRRGITFLDTVNKQVGSNMVGFNVSSSLTNFLPVVQTFAKTNKFDFVKAFAQTASNKISSIFGKNDGFADSSPVIIRRKGAERFYRTAWQKAGDVGYSFMSVVDDISTELIARTKYNELTRKGMDSQQAHIETDKWVSRLMGDRSLGQQPQLYNSKMLGLFTKFQLEVRNQLDSQFYDTIQETKASNEDIENGLVRNAKTAAKVTSTFFQLAVAQHLFGKAFESIAGYNPAFDILSVLATAFGFDDDEEDEDTALDNIEQAFLELLGDLPYTSTFTGGRIPISSALPIEEVVTGVDQYGNEKSRWETIGEVAPYYIMPGGYGQVKKTVAGLKMFSDDHPIAGSYTDSGNLRFPVEDTLGNRIQAGLFGQWASENARDYFDNDIAPLNEKQTQEFIDSDMPIQDYWKYRKGLSGLSTLAEKADYINSLDLTDAQKNVLINNLADRTEDIDMSDYGEYSGFEEFDFANKNPEKYTYFTENGISYEAYASADEDLKRTYTWAYEYPEKHEFLKEQGISLEDYSGFDDETKDAYSWAFNNPEKYKVSQVVTNDFLKYYQYKNEINDFDAKDSNGNTVSGLKKERVTNYINGLDLEYGQKIILFKSQYKTDDTYNYDIIEYLNGRDDISYEEEVAILKELGFSVSSDGTVTWD